MGGLGRGEEGMSRVHWGWGGEGVGEGRRGKVR